MQILREGGRVYSIIIVVGKRISFLLICCASPSFNIFNSYPSSFDNDMIIQFGLCGLINLVHLLSHYHTSVSHTFSQIYYTINLEQNSGGKCFIIIPFHSIIQLGWERRKSQIFLRYSIIITIATHIRIQ
jgi:hypothetical protein